MVYHYRYFGLMLSLSVFHFRFATIVILHQSDSTILLFHFNIITAVFFALVFSLSLSHLEVITVFMSLQSCYCIFHLYFVNIVISFQSDATIAISHVYVTTAVTSPYNSLSFQCRYLIWLLSLSL